MTGRPQETFNDDRRQKGSMHILHGGAAESEEGVLYKFQPSDLMRTYYHKNSKGESAPKIQLLLNALSLTHGLQFNIRFG